MAITLIALSFITVLALIVWYKLQMRALKHEYRTKIDDIRFANAIDITPLKEIAQ